MKILKILDSHDRGGVFTCERQYIEEMVRREITVDGLIFGEGDKKNVYEGILSHALPIRQEYKYKEFRRLRSMIFAKQYSARLTDQVLQIIHEDYDAIIYRRQYFMHLAGILGQKLNTPAYWFIANSIHSALSRYFYTWYVRKYNIIPIANSKYTRSTLPEVCSHYVYPGFEEEKIVSQRPVFRQKLDIPEKAPVYGVAARLSREKAHDLVIRAFKNSGLLSAGGHLLIAGGPLGTPWHDHLKRLAGALNNDRIHFLGQVEEMGSFYSSIDILVNGRRDAEPFGISIAEAMAFGKPVIAYHLGGPSEMIADDQTGWLVEKSQPGEYTDAFNKSLEQKTRWDEMGKKALERSSEFSSGNNVSRFLKILGDKQTASETPG